ncbi:hypothetical protein F4813DRAFT_371439 [Daldinia decipiens]|uniref:uncharacterized protein n=1 Tax=Daldinia decipiens TaxID=326647 RepID=UPI0020C1ED02|nr:uncharacterized protein F4813DRAFT_371439 [Daldinia decipiens]KAI1654327.1 hypothetical protein F4813DRAFT_371439 [Daldinia decipiens]
MLLSKQRSGRESKRISCLQVVVLQITTVLSRPAVGISYGNMKTRVAKAPAVTVIEVNMVRYQGDTSISISLGCKMSNG